MLITEVGGTVGDIESLPFLEAIRQFRKDVGRENVLYIHVTLVPVIGVVGELKTKPTQHSVAELREIGIQPDIIVARSEEPLSQGIREKIALFCDVDPEAVVSAGDADDIYRVVAEHAPREARRPRGQDARARVSAPPDLAEWEALVERIDACDKPVTIALVGKYVQLHEAYLSVWEALKHSAIHHGRKLDLQWVDSEELTPTTVAERLCGADGVIVPGRLRPARHRGQDRGHPLLPRAQACRSSACAWACSAPSPSSPATCATWPAPTPPSSTPRPRTRSSTCCPSRRTSRTWAAPCASAPPT